MSRLLPFRRLCSCRRLYPAGAALAWLLAACSPTYDWREVRGAGAPYTIALPARPVSHTRTIDLDGVPVSMTMTAAEADQVTFAVGTAELRDAAQARAALAAMKTALVRNIAGTLTQETAAPAAIGIEAVGPPAANGRPRLLLARFIAHDRRVYQLVVLDAQRAGAREAAETFFMSFQPQ